MICIVDDEPVYREALIGCLESQGYKTLAFVSVDGFLAERGKLSDVNLIISDINMPGKSGFDLCRIVRADNGNLYLSNNPKKLTGVVSRFLLNIDRVAPLNTISKWKQGTRFYVEDGRILHTYHTGGGRSMPMIWFSKP